MRWILHIDMDAFFAAVEQKRRPELAGRPVIVGGSGDPDGRGVVASASYEARNFKIHSAMPLRTARKLCPHAVFLPADYEEYVRISKMVKEILHNLSPVMEDVGIDEAYLDISSVPGNAEETGKEIKEKINGETGLTCSIGIGPNKLLAKTASDMNKPDGLAKIMEEDIEDLFWPLPIKRLRGVGPKTEARLNDQGIGTIGELADTPISLLIRLFGKSQGNYLFLASRGIDESEVVTHREPKSIGKETTFPRDTGKHQVIRITLAKLTKKVVNRMAEKGLRARSITVKVRFGDFETQTRAKTLPEPTDSLDTVRRAAFDCLGRFRLNKKLRLIGIRVGNLEGNVQQEPEGGDTLL
jgi:DNA polymerase-4